MELPIKEDFNEPLRIVQPVTYRLIHGGTEFFSLLEQLIQEAKTTIHLQTYIFEDDQTGYSIANALKKAAQKGVKVYLLTDGYASQSLSQHFIDDLRKAGINFRFFQPIFKSKNFYFGRRLHHKVVVVDSDKALVGGINITNRYNDLPGQRAWLDYALYAEGTIAQELCILCWKTWRNFAAPVVDAPCQTPITNVVAGNTAPTIVMRRNDWVRKKNEISSSYIQMFRKAQQEITIMCSYFLPGKAIRRVLHFAAKRGVRIKVIIAGTSDVKMAKFAERWLYDWLLRNQIEIYEYQPVVLHAKVAVCDNEWATIGSYNINNLSAYASIELNLDVKDKEFAQQLNRELDTLIAGDCISITKEKNKKNTNWINQFFHWFSYQFIRVVFYLMTFYYKQKRKAK